MSGLSPGVASVASRDQTAREISQMAEHCPSMHCVCPVCVHTVHIPTEIWEISRKTKFDEIIVCFREFCCKNFATFYQ
jgi:hypothetical protein